MVKICPEFFDKYSNLMSNKEINFKEKFRQALNSTIKVISDDLEIKKKSKKEKNQSKSDLLEFEILIAKMILLRARAASDSSALEKKFSDKIYKKNLT